MTKRFKKASFILMFTITTIAVNPQNTYSILESSQEEINIPADWAKVAIDKAKEIDIIPERIQGDYKNQITREEFSELALSLYEVLSGREVMQVGENPFLDTQNPKIIMANKLGIVTGKVEGIFSPDESITREEMSVIIYRTLQVAKPGYVYPAMDEYEFEDYDFISTWAKESVSYLYSIGVINGIGDNLFNPKGYTSREEAIVTVERMYNKVKETERDSRNSITVSRSSTSRRESSLRLKLKSLIPNVLGKPYIWGAVGPNGFDCSGLTYYLFGQLGITIPRTSKDQINVGTYVAKKDLEYGDLVLFARDGKNINHVGIYMGDGKFVHAPQSGDVVKITTLMSGYYANSYYTARRILTR